MKYFITTLLLCLAALFTSLSAQTIYQASDSIEVIRLLHLIPKGNDVLFYARQLCGRPYVGKTLEKADPEQLVVNLHELDCTTLVETSLALAITHRQHKTDFHSYCLNLERLRYFKGKNTGYLSRLHYFTWWFHDNIKKGIIEEVSDSKLYTAPIIVNNYYMSKYPQYYPFLRQRPDRVKEIRRMEKATNGNDGFFLPQEKTNLPHKQLNCIQNGDIIAIVTTKKGLDYSHLGIAVWGKDQRLHLLNASSLHHKVIEPTYTLHHYLNEHPTSIGIRTWRLK